MKKSIILAIGNELVEGIILDTNSKYISRKLLDFGYKTIAIKTLPDDMKILVEEIKSSLKKADLLITTGGLGPTEDDLTRESVSKAIGKKLVFSDKIYKSILEKIKKFHREVPENVKKQAWVIESAKVIENPVGTAPGQIIDNIIILPGPPVEMKPIFDKALNYIEKGEKIYQRRVKFLGIPEAVLVEKYKDIIYKHDINVATMASHITGVELRFTGERKKVDEIVNLLKEKLSDYIYAFDDKTIEEVVFEKLGDKTVSFAESCTGGLISSKFVSLPGVSKVFKGAIVAYSNEVKENVLNVSKNTIKTFGAVSKECVTEMAKGVCKILNSDYSVSVSGIAGPTGGTKEKPVGTVWICAYDRQKDVYLAKNFLFRGNRQIIREKSSLYALNLLRRIIE
ncbi:damage-inducible protein CinA [Thermosipho affectus]|uniref:CinA-like protein n=1 Tax=Thermosipho affectus TaxID=660294 RepID=A0ABX3IK72_9BACT|nr:competence/damage-inducible protein A [Thermosipho affectus]ONN27058.1 damage-inducible protein CinA [Thermosipho affectus]